MRFSGGKTTVIDGPFAKRAPFGEGTVIEIRQLFEAEDFGAELTPELREQEEQLSRRIKERR